MYIAELLFPVSRDQFSSDFSQLMLKCPTKEICKSGRLRNSINALQQNIRDAALKRNHDSGDAFTTDDEGDEVVIDCY